MSQDTETKNDSGYQQLLVQKGIRHVEDDLVRAIEAALVKANTSLEESQFRNLLRVSESTESIEVIKNFLRYQVGRDNKWGRGKDSLAEQIIRDIDGLISILANQIANEAQITNQKEIQRILLDLIRRYFGYGARRLVFIRKGQPESKK